MHNKRKKNGLVALKLNISKAYNRVEWKVIVEWKFLKQTMLKLGFASDWVELIVNCITTSSFSILVNSVSKNLIQPQRELRQRCPFSSYLFLMCVEPFSNLLVQVERHQLIPWLIICQEYFNFSLTICKW